MRLGAVRSELTASVGFSAGPGQVGTLRIRYTDGAVFDYKNVLYAVFRKIVTSKHPGEYWLFIRDQYKYKEV
jgi:hypothetical protein